MDTNKVIELLEKRGPWMTRLAVCTTCCHEWVAVQVYGGDPSHLECPQCGHMTGGVIDEDPWGL